ncbi:S-layer homology domain-containing protein [Paenibacillus sp. 1_12]|uniref:S-layer homology domain-containing protein n=1 Tax=Paenibacillus sp. 1_12 TaxID=1566278 RepID=UPI0008E56A01|nr:S-layer homology domain-containing protein [Paenibacillus sp. 1_12]SFL69090.1 S-layer homology domain-containing protein [Paenibacillus sp. 1_12]
MIYSKSNVILPNKTVTDRARANRIIKNKIKLMIALSVLSLIRKTVYVMAAVTLPFSLLFPSHTGFARSNETVIFSDTFSAAEPGSTAAANGEERSLSFSDMSGHWAEAPIREAAANGFISGFEDGTFKPDHSLTQGEFAALLTASLGIPNLASTIANSVPNAANPTELSIHNGNIQSLSDVGIMKENEFTSDEWDRELTRSVLILLCLRVMEPETMIDETLLEQRAIAAGLLDGKQEEEDTKQGHVNSELVYGQPNGKQEQADSIQLNAITKQVQAAWAAKVATRAEAVVITQRLRKSLGLADPNQEMLPY